MYWTNGQGDQSRSGAQVNTFSRPSLSTINVIFAALGRTGSQPSRVMSVTQLLTEKSNRMPKRARIEADQRLNFLDKDKVGTIQPHDDALVITLRIGGYDVKRVMVDQGSGVEIIYLDLYKGLNLRPEDLATYDLPLVSFDGKAVIPKGKIRLPMQAGLEMVEVTPIPPTWLSWEDLGFMPWRLFLLLCIRR